MRERERKVGETFVSVFGDKTVDNFSLSISHYISFHSLG